MIEKIIKAVKSSNKKRNRNITIGAVIGFLLSCTVVMGADDNYLWIGKNDGEEIKFSIDGTTTSDGEWKTENPYENAGNIWDKDTEPKTYTNNTTLSSNAANGNDSGYISYGLRLSGNLTGVNFVNNGSIIGKMSSSSGSSYGIYNSGTMGNIENTGVISGYSSGSSGYGYGINNESGTIGDIANAGVISGAGISSSGYGYGINNKSGKIGDITNTGLISGYGTSTFSSGSGIYNGSSTMGKITNTGLISGYAAGTSTAFAYGICNDSNGKEMGAITNTGIISGYSTSSSSFSVGSGIYNKSGTIGDIKNAGLISGIGNSTSGAGTGSGIYNKSGTIGDIKNAGLISGYGTGSSSVSEGYGIYNKSGTIGDITNTGVIYGKTNAINKNSGTIDPSSNYGILVNGDGGKGVVDGLGIVDKLTIVNGIPNKNQILNKGLIFKAVDGGYKAGENEYGKFGQTYEDESIVIGYQEDGTGKLSNPITKKYTIINAKAIDEEPSNIDTEKNIVGTESLELKKGTLFYTDSKNTSKEETISSSKGYILNGITNTLEVSEGNNELNGSVINAYGTAVVFGDTGDKELTLSGTIVNGGIDESDSNPGTKVAAILGSDNGDTLILQSIVSNQGTQNTVVNGNINMGAGADTLTIGDGTIINGILDGGDSTSKDTLNFGVSSGAKSIPGESQGINIMHNISNFENMNINTNVTLYEKTINASGEVENLKVTGAEKITIEENGTLTLRIDSTNKDNLSGKIIGHALYGNTGEISSTGGKLLLALNGAGNQSIISFGDTKLNTSLVTAYEGEYYEDVTFGTTSLIHSVKRVNNTENEVEITVKKNLPLKALKYEKLNKIYHGILSVDDLIANFNVDSNEKLSTFLGYLNDIYAGNLYSYSSELSRKSVGMFRDIATENQFKPELNKWLIMGGLTHVDGGTKDTYYGKGYYTYDIGSSDMDADTKITGAYMLGEYGVSDTLAYGVLIGGNKLKSELSNGSKVDGDALYMGAYVKKYVGNLKVTGGLGLQYGDYDADRIAINKVASSLAEPVMKYCDNYNDMTYDIYLNGRYSHNIGNNLFLEPYGTLSYTYIKQDSADEGSKVLAIETDSKSFDYTAAKVGVDIKKVIPHEKGKSTLSAGVSYTRLLTGSDEENITGRFKGENATDFDILVAHKNEQSIGVNAKYALELENGVLFDVKGSYNVERDSHNGSGKNRTKGEWIVGVGIGYKF
ncbi:autotransporter outer membrane beta-barrel domain-containing protein [Fusobacterium varium]